jgi:hypothetical protein
VPGHFTWRQPDLHVLFIRRITCSLRSSALRYDCVALAASEPQHTHVRAPFFSARNPPSRASNKQAAGAMSGRLQIC